MNLTILVLLLPVALFWAWTEYWQVSELLFGFWVLSALACLARGIHVLRTNKSVGLVCIGVICIQVVFLVVPRLLHAGGKLHTGHFGGDVLLNYPVAANPARAVSFNVQGQRRGVAGRER